MIWWFVAAFMAFFIKGICGFANALVFSSILSFTADNVNITPVELILGYPTNVIVAWTERKHLKWDVCLPLMGIVLLSNIVGVLFLKNCNTGLVKLVFGFVIVALGVQMLLQEFHLIQWRDSRFMLVVIGVASGILSGLYGIGALNSVYVSRRTSNSHEFKANICFVFMCEATFRTIMYIVFGIVNWGIVRQALILAPVMLVSLYAGMACCRWLNEKVIRKIVVVLLILSGIALIIAAKSML